jgi:hypothetical protein
MTNGDGRDIIQKPTTSPSAVPLGPVSSINLDFLPEAERNALLKDYARKVLDVGAKAQELHVDVSALKVTLDQLAGTTRDVAESGSAVTIAHTQTTKVGRTEVKMGNTEEARSGKLSKSQTGERDWTPYYIFGAIVAVILIAFLFAGRH